MFNPSRDEVREMFFAAWRKYCAGQPLVGIEALAIDVVLQHPEYHDTLRHPDRYRDRDYVDESNPFLHMSLHLALEEQLSQLRRDHEQVTLLTCFPFRAVAPQAPLRYVVTAIRL